MPAPYGVVPAGFSKKILAEILAEIELSEQAQWGAAVVLDAASPLGQINGIFSDGSTEVWEVAEAVYQAYDPNIAVGTQLDRIARLRGLTRLVGETDTDFRQRINNLYVGSVKTRELYNRLANVAGVTWINITENATANTTASGMPPHSLNIAVVGGTAADVAQTIWDYTVSGIELVGATITNHTDVDGLCRAIKYTRPTDVPIQVHIHASIDTDRCACSATAAADVATELADGLGASCSMSNGMLLSVETVTRHLSGQTGLVPKCVTFSRVGEESSTKPIQFDLAERPTLVAGGVTVSLVDACL